MVNRNPLIDATNLTQAQRGYLLGLYLADGCLVRISKNSFGIVYSLQPNEGELADLVALLLRSANLKTHTHHVNHGIVVTSYSMNLGVFFPNKMSLLRCQGDRRRFFEQNDLMRNLENKTAFAAGLLDGDGTCKPYLRKFRNGRWSDYGRVQVNWEFSQIKYSFLCGFFSDFAESLEPHSSRKIYRYGKLVAVRMNHKGQEALLQAGIAKWSWKARKCIEEVSKLTEQREKIRGTRLDRIKESGIRLTHIAKTLGVGREWLYELRRKGKLVAVPFREWGRRGPEYLVIPRDEVERLLADRKRMARERSMGMKLTSAAKVIGVCYTTLYRMIRSGRLRATWVRNWGQGGPDYLVVSRDDIERLKSEYQRNGRNRIR